jgi:glyoxylase-like metal-dependent hydrolase (beta-lactamase superfamily II)
MWIQVLLMLSLLSSLLFAERSSVHAQTNGNRAILEETAQAMGGLQKLRALKNQVVESEGQQFEPEQALRPGGQPRHVADFRLRLTREIAKPRLRLEWDGKTFYPRESPVRYLEIVDGNVGMLQEGSGVGTSKQTRLHPGRLASRLREERRAAAGIILTALREKSLKRLPDARLDGKPQHVLAFQDKGEEFRLYLDSRTKLPTQVEIFEDDTIYGDSRYTLRYADWRRVDGLMVPFSLRYEINGILLQNERMLSVRNNVALTAETFLIPESVRRQEVEGKPIPSQWLMRRLAMNVSYLDFGKDIPVDLVSLADGILHAKGTSHNSVIIEMRDYLVVVEAPLYEERSQKVLAAIKQRFPSKPIRYVIPTHFHNDHSGGMRAYMAVGTTIIAPAISMGHYERMAKAPHSMRPDRLEQSRKAVIVEGITGRRLLTDGSRQIEIYPYPTAHADDYQIIYLPREKLLFEADHVSPREGGSIRPGELPRQMLEGIEQLNLNVERIVGIHGDVGTYQNLRSAVRGPTR